MYEEKNGISLITLHKTSNRYTLSVTDFIYCVEITEFQQSVSRY